MVFIYLCIHMNMVDSSSCSNQNAAHAICDSNKGDKLLCDKSSDIIKLQPIVSAAKGDEDGTFNNVDLENDRRTKVFFVESSKTDYLHQRQACAIESMVETQRSGRAGKKSNILVIVVMTSSVLNIEANNASQQIYKRYIAPFRNAPHNAPVVFRYAGEYPPDSILLDTPLDTDGLWGYITSNPDDSFRIAHISDTFRLALIYRFGGWYADFDTVSLKSLDELGEGIFFSTDHIGFNMADNNTAELANGFFGFVGKPFRKSKFLYRAMELFPSRYNREVWTSGGSGVLSQALRDHCYISDAAANTTMMGHHDSEDKCQGIHVIEPYNFFPIPWQVGLHLLTPPRTEKEWKNTFRKSYSVDFYRSSLGITRSIMKPKFYGSKLPAYAYLGPKYCPLSFYSEKFF